MQGVNPGVWGNSSAAKGGGTPVMSSNGWSQQLQKLVNKMVPHRGVGTQVSG